MSDNILTILGIQSREDAITNLLAHCFNSIQEFQPVFLRSVCGCEPVAAEQWHAFTRLTLSDSGIPDLVLNGRRSDRNRIIVIENKLKADEGDDQTVRYSSEGATRFLLQRFAAAETPAYVFLTLFPDQQPRAGAFWRMATYRDLLHGARSTSLPPSCTGTRLLSDWLELVADFYSFETTDPDDLLLERLQADNGLEGNFLYFTSFVRGLHLPPGLDLEDWFRSSQTGRRYFGAVISKPDWHPEEMVPTPSGGWHIDATKHYNIHIEPQFNVLAGVLSLYIHYEINPYRPNHWFVENVSANERQAYLDARQRFVSSLEKRRPANLAIGGGCNQIAKATYDFTGASTAAAAREVERLIESASAAIDCALDEVWSRAS
jgi:hypothetical protein